MYELIAPYLMFLLKIEAAGLVLQVPHIWVECLREPQDGERSVHGGVCARAKREHLNADVRQVGHVRDVVQLLAHRLGAADDTADHGLVEDGPQLYRTVVRQPLLSRRPYGDLASDLFFVAGGRRRPRNARW